MSIHSFSVPMSVARGIRRTLKKQRPDSHFEIIGRHDRHWVKETHADGHIETHGRSIGYGRTHRRARLHSGKAVRA